MKFASVATRPARPAVPAARRDTVRLAFDRASVRRTDQDGHLHVEASPISKACVSGYWGREIPDGERLGLDPDRLYQLLRDPAELAKAARSFAGKALLSVHRPLTADDHAHKVVVGSIGQDVRWQPPYLVASLSVWDGAAIEGIESGAQRQLSAGYRYRALPEPGTYQGTPYDLRMVDIVGNHVALVVEGRAGPDVVVGDSAPQQKGKFKMARDDDAPGIDKDTRAALMDYLADYLGPAELEAVTQILAGETVAPAMAGDAAARRAAGRAQEERAFLERFPGADRLR